MQIQIVTANVTTQTNSKNKPMQVLEVIYKNLTFQGKVETKKLFDFGAQKDVFPVLAASQTNQVYEVDVVKNSQGYNDWVKIQKSNGSGTTTDAPTVSPKNGASVGAATPAKQGTWETPEERAKKQIYIVRQSSLSAAIATLTVGRKTELKPGEVIGLASEYEAFVFGADSVEDTVAQDVNSVAGFEDFKDDIPF